MPTEFFASRSPWLSWTSLTWFGDSNLLLPAGAAMFLALLLSVSARGLAVRWALAFGLTGFVVLITKVAFVAWGVGSAELDFTGFSGHSALSACFWPAWAWLVTAPMDRPGLRRSAVVAAYLLALLIAVSRLMLEVHSVSEVVSGLVVGIAGSLWFLAGTRERKLHQRPGMASMLIALGTTAMMTIVLHGKPAPTTHWIETSVMQMLGITTPFTRHDLRLRLQRHG